ncbi:FG-GAP repeat domain-containing protein [Actinoplanes sp. CA-252034]|uniref:FG-GAP repeat domain-containing protein n=1 Tax=Actinoplanes sp. CA-252034 TaxID=3239906 RepID=UPI003D983605
MTAEQTRSTTRRLLSAMTVAAAAFFAPLPAFAGAPVTAAPGAQAPCLPGAVSAADRAIADELRPAMNGPRLGPALTGRNIACARAIITTVRARGLDPRAAVIALTTAIAESTLNNHMVALDHDSLGLFQQRPSQGWGRPDQVVDPVYATNAFLTSMLRKHPGDSWRSGDIGAICQRVQRSAFPGAYAPEAHDAQLIVERLWARPADPVVPSVPGTPEPTPSATPTGPFQQALTVAGTQLGPIDGRNDLALADWNEDGRPDLVVVKGTKTVTGKTEIRIMDGATGFSSLLLDRATALGPTDERHAYAITDWNADRRPDLMVVQRSGTASGHTEVTVLDGASAFRRQLLHTTTALAATDDTHRFAAADWNGDGRPDLVVTQVSGAAGGKMAVQVLDGAADLRRSLTPVTTLPEPASTEHRVLVADVDSDRHPDVVVVQESQTADGKSRVRAYDGAKGLQSLVVDADTAPGATGHLDMLVTDWNGDKRADLMMVQKTGAASGRTELVVLGG